MSDMGECFLLLVTLIILFITLLVLYLQEEHVCVSDCIKVVYDVVNSTDITRIPLVNKTMAIKQ
jgi:hypothetical protein